MTKSTPFCPTKRGAPASPAGEGGEHPEVLLWPQYEEYGC